MSEFPTAAGQTAAADTAGPNEPGVGGPLGPLAPAGSRYRLLEELARGGMGIVYRATDTVLDREVAVKVLHESLGATPPLARRFIDEARVTGQLQHPGIPAVHDLDKLPDGRPLLAMKLVKGRTLADHLAQRPSPAADRGRFLAVFEQVCQAVAYAHDHQVLHRDLKPANVMVGGFGEVQVMDWGLAKVLTARPGPAPARPRAEAPATEIRTARESDGQQTLAGSVLGTPAYMPPEQAGGEVDRIDERADVFGLGAILAVVLTGEPPYVGGDNATIRLMAVRGQLDDCRVRLDACGAEPELVALAKRCLAYDPADRPRNAGEVARQVAGLRAAAEQRARQAEVEQVKAQAEAHEQRKRRRTQLALAVALILLTAAAGVVTWWRGQEAAAQQARLARNAEALDELLASCEVALRAGNAGPSATVLAEAERRLPDGGGEEQRGRLDACRSDLAVLRDLDAIDQFRWALDGNHYPELTEVARRWRVALERAGAAPGPDAARRVAGSSVRDRLVTALDLWLIAEAEAATREQVRALLRAVDPHPFRDAVRDALLSQDANRTASLAGQDEALAQPAGFTAALGHVRAIPAGRRRQVLQAALFRQPADLALLMTLGSTYRLDRRDTASERVRWYQAAIAVAPQNPAIHTNLGTALQERGDLDGAIRELREAVRLAPDFVWAHNNLANALREKGDFAEATAHGREALRLGPTLGMPRANLGLLLLDQGDVDGALVQLDEALRLDPRPAGIHYQLGRARYARNDVAGAMAAYRESMRRDPEHPYPHNGLGWVLYESGDADGAMAEFRAASALDPGYAYPHNNLGLVLARCKGDLDGAAAEYREALRLEPGQPVFRRNLDETLRWRELLPRLPAVADGRAEPATPAEAVEFAGLCMKPFQRRYLASVRLFEKALDAEPRLADDLAADPRYDAACAAALAADGKDGGGASIAPEERGRLRTLALTWLRADLALWKRLANEPGNRAQVGSVLRDWKRDPDLAALREPARRAALSPAEQAAWAALWAEVDATLGPLSQVHTQ